jgi:hypothetical protein
MGGAGRSLLLGRNDPYPTNAESNVLLQAMENGGGDLDLTQIKMYPCVVPERGAGERTMEAALAILNERGGRNRPPEKKPRWKYW